MPIVCACLMVACLKLTPSCSIVRFSTSAVKDVPLSLSMVFGMYACLVTIDIRTFTTDCASGRMKRSANIYLENTSAAVIMYVKPFEGGSGPTKSIFNISSGPLIQS